MFDAGYDFLQVSVSAEVHASKRRKPRRLREWREFYSILAHNYALDPIPGHRDNTETALSSGALFVHSISVRQHKVRCSQQNDEQPERKHPEVAHEQGSQNARENGDEPDDNGLDGLCLREMYAPFEFCRRLQFEA
jgi:hypothetical protein